METWLIFFEIGDDLIGLTKVDLFKTLLKECIRGKLQDDPCRITRALGLLVPLLALGSISTSLSAGFSLRSPGCIIQFVFCCVLSSLS